MKILLLVNHDTAAKFYSSVLKYYNHEIYIPLYCSIEKLLLEYDNVKKYRTMNIDLLDKFDFYNQNINENQIDIIINYIKENFDMIITYHPINLKLNEKLLEINKKIYFIVWGCLDNDIFWDYKNRKLYDKIIINHNSFFAIAHSYILNTIKDQNILKKIKFLPLGLIVKNNKFINLHKNDNNKILIIFSKITNNIFTEKIKMINGILNKFNNIKFTIIGKYNSNIFNKNNVNLIEFKNVDEIYNEIINYKFAISLNLHENILQYSSIEYSMVRIPFIYHKKSVVNKILSKYEDNEIFIYDDNNIIKKIKHILSLNDDKLKKLSDYQKKLYYLYSFDMIKGYWNNLT